jgi:hypothetical protein
MCVSLWYTFRGAAAQRLEIGTAMDSTAFHELIAQVRGARNGDLRTGLAGLHRHVGFASEIGRSVAIWPLRRSGANRYSTPMTQDDRYTLVVTRSGNSLSPWVWEICRDGAPLPVPLRESGYKSEWIARKAGKAALREFLSALTREQKNTA